MYTCMYTCMYMAIPGGQDSGWSDFGLTTIHVHLLVVYL